MTYRLAGFNSQLPEKKKRMLDKKNILSAEGTRAELLYKLFENPLDPTWK